MIEAVEQGDRELARSIEEIAIDRGSNLAVALEAIGQERTGSIEMGSREIEIGRDLDHFTLALERANHRSDPSEFPRRELQQFSELFQVRRLKAGFPQDLRPSSPLSPPSWT
jgi:hypothetical protein